MEIGTVPDHPFMVRQSIEKRVNGKIEGAISEAQGKTYALKVRSKFHLDRLLSMTQLNDGTAVKVDYHPGLNSVRCVVSCRDLTKIKTDEDLIECMKDQNITNVRRIKRKVGDKVEFTPTVILTVSGTTRPDFVDVGYQRIRTRPYYPAPMLCYQCYQFGHTRQRCKENEETCGHCSKKHEVIKGVRCDSPAYCPRCQSANHSVGSRSCPEYIKENEIQHIRVDNGIDYPEARRLYNANHSQRSFAGITVHSKDAAIAQWSAKCQTLAGEVAAKDARIKELEEKEAIGANNIKTNNNSEDFTALKKLVEALQADVAEKNQRIQMLEEANQGVNSRLDIVRKHGTIEDIVARLTALEESAARKDEEILALRKENEAYKKILGNKLVKTMRQQSTKDKTNPRLNKTNPATTTKNQSTTPVTPIVSETPVKDTDATVPEGTPKPKYTGTKPKTKKVLETPNDEPDQKRTKEDYTPMYISDTEESTTTNCNSLTSDTSTQPLNITPLDISDDGMGDEDEVEILP